ncbi:uncharacterized protein LOC120779298 [Bactrocera tryoni]|uniref:uncharacterized protein LOC120779298 n=1 Tax=Bactrocera tryoni TaxID=59916 RepID=UPI001A95D77F|nr:uncharacterized protein LOC120779298 [Bactrocera tryoni]
MQLQSQVQQQQRSNSNNGRTCRWSSAHKYSTAYLPTAIIVIILLATVPPYPDVRTTQCLTSSSTNIKTSDHISIVAGTTSRHHATRTTKNDATNTAALVNGTYDRHHLESTMYGFICSEFGSTHFT